MASSRESFLATTKSSNKAKTTLFSPLVEIESLAICDDPVVLVALSIMLIP